MPVCKTVLIGETVLRETAKLVVDPGATEVKTTINNLIDTMRAEELIGLSAPQIGISLRIMVTEIRETKYRTGVTDKIRIYINPKITHISRETNLDWEGCGSIPGLFGKVDRATEITLTYQDETGVSREMKATDLLARVIQHEIDHLNGILFTDLADPKTLVSREYYLQHIQGKE